MTVTKKTIHREDTAANWTSSNPTLVSGVYGHETDTGKIKKGDGSTAWTSLAYTDASDVPVETDIEESIDTFETADGYVHFLDTAGTVVGFKVGVKANTVGSGLQLKATTETSHRAAAVYADDGGAQIITGNSVAAFEGRTLIGFSQGAADLSFTGVQGHVKLAAGITAGSSGCRCGVWGYFETVGTGVVGNLCCGVMAMIDVDSTSSITGVASALYIKSNDLSGTHTGKVAAIRVDAPGAGVWDYLMSIAVASGLAVANTKLLTAGAGNCTLNYILPIRCGSADGWIPVLAAVPAT